MYPKKGFGGAMTFTYEVHNIQESHKRVDV